MKGANSIAMTKKKKNWNVKGGGGANKTKGWGRKFAISIHVLLEEHFTRYCHSSLLLSPCYSVRGFDRAVQEQLIVLANVH